MKRLIATGIVLATGLSLSQIACQRASVENKTAPAATIAPPSDAPKTEAGKSDDIKPDTGKFEEKHNVDASAIASVEDLMKGTYRAKDIKITIKDKSSDKDMVSWFGVVQQNGDGKNIRNFFLTKNRGQTVLDPAKIRILTAISVDDKGVADMQFVRMVHNRSYHKNQKIDRPLSQASFSKENLAVRFSPTEVKTSAGLNLSNHFANSNVGNIILGKPTLSAKKQTIVAYTAKMIVKSDSSEQEVTIMSNLVKEDGMTFSDVNIEVNEQSQGDMNVLDAAK